MTTLPNRTIFNSLLALGATACCTQAVLAGDVPPASFLSFDSWSFYSDEIDGYASSGGTLTGDFGEVYSGNWPTGESNPPVSGALAAFGGWFAPEGLIADRIILYGINHFSFAGAGHATIVFSLAQEAWLVSSTADDGISLSIDGQSSPPENGAVFAAGLHTLQVDFNYAQIDNFFWEFASITFHSTPVPAPGALALLAFAGAAGGRRRR